ncbi:MAG: hypothetical protein Fur0032_06610 [Terrimicrobiaceae bacterium]
MKPITRTGPLVYCLAASLAGCKAPTVNLGTPEPIKVDISMRLDVYQHGGNKTASSVKAAAAPATPDPASRRRNRMADIQKFKNERLVGEGRDGLVAVVNLPPGEYGDYVRKLVAEENADRLEQMKDLAEARKISLADIQKEQAVLWINRSFVGELVEMSSGDGWTWQPKK